MEKIDFRLNTTSSCVDVETICLVLTLVNPSRLPHGLNTPSLNRGPGPPSHADKPYMSKDDKAFELDATVLNDNFSASGAVRCDS